MIAVLPVLRLIFCMREINPMVFFGEFLDI